MKLVSQSVSQYLSNASHEVQTERGKILKN